MRGNLSSSIPAGTVMAAARGIDMSELKGAAIAAHVLLVAAIALPASAQTLTAYEARA
mgnify:CR=1 FL=1